MVLDHSDLKRLRTIPAGDRGEVRDVAVMHDGDIVIASSNGLFHDTMYGKHLHCTMRGQKCAETCKIIANDAFLRLLL